MKKPLKDAEKQTANKADPSLMNKEVFFNRVNEAIKGSSKSFANVDKLDKYIRSL